MSMFPFSLSTMGGGRMLAIAEAPKSGNAGEVNRCLVVALGIPSVRFVLLASTAEVEIKTVPAVDGVAAYTFTNPAAGARYVVAVADPAGNVGALASDLFTISDGVKPVPEPEPEPEEPTPEPEPPPPVVPAEPTIALGPVDASTLKVGQATPITVRTTGMAEFEWVVVQSNASWSWRGNTVKVKATGNDVVMFQPVAVGDFLRVHMAGRDSLYALTPPTPAAAVTPAPTPTPVPTPIPNPEPSPAGVQAPPDGWRDAFRDDFDRPAVWGVNALDPAKWGHRNYGSGGAHQGSSTWDNARGTEATGSTLRVHAIRRQGRWFVDGFQHGAQNRDRNGYAYHAGWGEFHTRFRMRMSHKFAPGVGGYCLMWPAKNDWSSELDIVETPGDTKNRAEACMHWDSRGQYNLGQNNTTSTVRDTIDLSLWNTWDFRRTYRQVNGKNAATITMWINGVRSAQPKEWVDNPYLDEHMMFGAASYVAASGQTGWYGLPKSNTPDDVFMELDYVRIWAPA